MIMILSISDPPCRSGQHSKYFEEILSQSDVFEDFCNPTAVIADKLGWGRKTYEIPKEGQGYDTYLKTCLHSPPQWN